LVSGQLHPANAGFSALFRIQTLNKTMKDRKPLTDLEIGKLMDATAGSRNAALDRCLLLLTRPLGLAASPRVQGGFIAFDSEAALQRWKVRAHDCH
jgi:hypothetical protein